MSVRTEELVNSIVHQLQIPEEDLVSQSLRLWLENQLRTIKAEIFEVTGRYGVSGVEEMDARYRDGTLEEAGSWRDFQRLDHLEYHRDRLADLIESIK